MPVKALMFDLGGVLVRTVNTSFQNKWERSLGIPTGDLPRWVVGSEVSKLATEGKLTAEDAWSQIGCTLSLNSKQLKQFQHDYFAGDRLNPKLRNFIMTLRHSYITAILSNAWSGAREFFNKRYSLDYLVDMIIYSAEERAAKPDLQIYFVAAEKIKVKTQEIIFVDDFEENVKAACQAGMHGIHFQSPEQVINEIQKLLTPELNI